jgi:hypothetical protein
MNYATKYPTAWRLFFFLSLVAFFSTTAYDIYRSRNLGFFDLLIGITFGFFSLVPLYGYVYQRAIATPKVWRVYFWFTVFGLLISVFGLVVSVGFAKISGSNLILFGLLTALWIAYSAYLFAIDQYANKSNHLWVK